MLEVRLLGELAIHADGRPLPAPAGRPARALLGWLGLHPGRHARTTVAAHLWPDVLDESARTSLRTALAALRRDLGPGADSLVASREEVALDGDALWVDVRAFDALAAEGSLEEAAALARGPLLPGLDDEWALVARDEHRARVLGLVLALCRAAAERDDAPEALRLARDAAALDPLSEEAHRALVAALAASGDRAAALTADARFRERLRRELGVAPSAATRQLVDALRSDVAAAGASSPPRTAVAAAHRPPLPPLLAPRRESGFVGRRQERARVDAAARRAAEGERTLVLLAGEPGIGKTRLAAEVARTAHAAGAVVLAGRCAEEPLAPYEPFVQALGRLAGALPDADLADLLGPTAGELGTLVPGLAARLPDAVAVAGDPEGARYRLFEAVDGLVERLGADAPVVLVVDDVQWADRGSLLLLRDLLGRREPARLLVLATVRDEEVGDDHPAAPVLAALRRDRIVETVPLGPLAAEEIEELAGPVGAEAGGNPFFAEELSRHVAEAGPAALPQTVRDVLGRRLGRLTAEARRVLAAAAVIGEEWDASVLAPAVGVEPDRLLDVLDEALAARLVREEGRPGRFAFAHALVRTALLSELSAARVVRLHELVADALDPLADAAPDRYLAPLAHHRLEAARGGAVDAAVEAGARAVSWAAGCLAYEEAAAIAARTLAVLDAAGAPDDERRIELLLGLGHASGRAGDVTASHRAYDDAAALARRHGRPEAFARAALGRGGVGVHIGREDPAFTALLEESLGALGDRDDALRARLLGRLATERYYPDPPAEADERTVAAVALARASGDDAALLDALNARRAALWRPDRLDDRLAVATEMLAVARAAGRPEAELQARNWLVVDHMERGETALALAEIDAHEALADELRLPGYRWFTPSWRATLAIAAGRLEEGEALGEQAWALGRTAAHANARLAREAQRMALVWLADRRFPEDILRYVREGYAASAAPHAWRSSLAWILADRGETAEAQEHLDATVAAADAIPHDMNVLSALAEIANAAELLDDAVAGRTFHDLCRRYAGQMIVVGRGGLLVGSADQALGILAQVAGDREQAIAHLEDAVALEARAGAEAFRQRAEARLAALRGHPGGKR